MFLSKASNGYYYLWYTDENGKRQKRSTRTKLKGEAMRMLAGMVVEQPAQPRSIRFSDFTPDLLEHAKSSFSPATVEIYERTLGHFSKLHGDVPLASINARHIDKYKAYRRTTVGPATVNMELRCLKAVFNTARRWKLITENPCTEVTAVPVPDAVPSFFSPEDFSRFMAVIEEPWFKEIVIFAVLTGLRRGEICNLRWDCVDLERRVLRIHTTPTYKTKQGKRRVVPLHPVANEILTLKKRGPDDGYVFTLNGQQVYDEWAARLLKRYVRNAKLSNQALHFHSLRHTFASWLVQDGVSLYEVQKLLGHSSPAVTQVYSHLQPDQMHATVNRIAIPTGVVPSANPDTDE